MKGALNPKRGNLSSTESVHRVKKKRKKKKVLLQKITIYGKQDLFG